MLCIHVKVLEVLGGYHWKVTTIVEYVHIIYYLSYSMNEK